VAELLPFFEEELAGALFVVAEGVVYGKSDLVGDEGEITDLLGRIVIGLVSPETKATEAAIRGGEGKDASSLQVGLFIQLHHAREAGLRIPGRDDYRLLVIVDPPGDGFFGGKIGGDDEFRTLHGFEQASVHSIFFGVVEKNGDEIEGHDLAKFFGEDAE
jgi:hypothetical protein